MEAPRWSPAAIALRARSATPPSRTSRFAVPPPKFMRCLLSTR